MRNMKRKQVMGAALMAAAALSLASCSTSKHAQKDSADHTQTNIQNDDIASLPSTDMNTDPDFLILTDDQREIVQKNNTFAFSLFDKVQGMESKVISPLSVAYLMGMLANGAEGTTQQEILKAIGCEGVSVKQLNELYKSLLTAGNQDPKTTINIANYVAVNKNYQLNSDFSNTLADYYKAGVESLNFSSPKSTERINGWCKEHTNGMIPKIIDQTDASAVSYIMNAIYFKGTWQEKFDAKNTKQENFQGYTRNIQKVDMMHLDKKFYYTENELYKAVDLPYGNGVYRMLVLLPNEGKGIGEMMKTLDAEKLQILSNNMEKCVVDLKLPKFTTEMELPLNQIVSELGAPSMFSPATANFSHFANGDFFVSKMFQKAKIEVSEEGTKAAAVTAAIMLTSAAPMSYRHVDFHATRPFVYMIQDTNSGAILFMGQYTGNN